MTELPVSRSGIESALCRLATFESLMTMTNLSILPYSIVLNAPIGRPIWIDEFLHFAFEALHLR
ncbi:hypothetical protein AB8B02_06165 [Tardiphaga sp. 862_B3_N4_1]|uniref:hypothetical protein n=1 Tax=Tardiphaga sp. 862_B3_N4_1 TaxID=3240764 RepID=UPI003F1E5A84